MTVFIACAGLPAWAGTGDLLAAARVAAQQDRNAEAARLSSPLAEHRRGAWLPIS